MSGKAFLAGPDSVLHSPVFQIIIGVFGAVARFVPKLR
jgi:hypothetical protein